jgi:3'-5' exoribonuclease
VTAAAEKTWVRDLEPGSLVDSTFVVLRKERRRARTGSTFLSLELADRTGRVHANVFDDAVLLDGRFDQGDTVRVLGSVEEYRGRAQVVVRSIERVAPGDPLVYVPGARRDTEDLEGFLEFLIMEIGDTTLRALVEAVYAEGRFRALFRQAPVTAEGHHAYAGGAMQHTVAVATVCREVAQLHPKIDESVLAAAALTFCVGAADAFLPGASIQLGEEGRLLGLAHLSARRVEREALRLRTPRERLVPLIHCICGQKGRTREAVALHAAITLDGVVADTHPGTP